MVVNEKNIIKSSSPLYIEGSGDVSTSLCEIAELARGYKVNSLYIYNVSPNSGRFAVLTHLAGDEVHLLNDFEADLRKLSCIDTVAFSGE